MRGGGRPAAPGRLQAGWSPFQHFLLEAGPEGGSCLQRMRQVWAASHIALSIVRNCAARAHCMFAAVCRQRAQRREALLTRGTALTFHPSTDFSPAPLVAKQRLIS